MSLNAIFFHFPRIPHVHCLFPLRDEDAAAEDKMAGNLSFLVEENEPRVRFMRRRILDRYRPHGLQRLCDVHQVHGTELCFLKQASLGNDMVVDAHLAQCEADGLATEQAGLGLLIKTADCQPVLICDLSGTYLLALHVGWRGNAKNFIGSAIATFCKRYALSPDQLLAVRGPSLGPDSAEFVNFSREWPETFSPWFDAQSRTMDLWQLTRHQLVEAGLTTRHIFGLDLCTASHSQCFSYRRDRICGRQGGIIWREADAADL